jgi:molecular chaperone HtpG
VTGEQDQAATHAFQVDLRGLVDLLSHHLYSSPKVYLRELLQNAVDAITARRADDPTAPASIEITITDAGLRLDDSGIGLTESDVHEFLATIGRSSKRDTIAGVEAARADFIGQFGIGLLACFLVADEIDVVSRSAVDLRAAPVSWRATSDGAYTVRVLGNEERTRPGTTVYLTARPGAEQWLASEKVTELAQHFGSLLPYEITVRGNADATATPINQTPPVWRRTFDSPSERDEALAAYAVDAFGFRPLDTIDLYVPAAGLQGVAYVLPSATNPAQTGRHRVYLKGMLLSDALDRLLPDWAFFVRCVIETDSLRPTAAREGLYEDDMLFAVRDALGATIRGWLTDLAANQPERLQRFLAVHELGVKALACHDDELYRIMLPWLALETTDGEVSLAEFASNHRTIYLADTVAEFRQVAPIASAQGLGVVNGGHVYNQELVRRLPVALDGSIVERLAADVLVAHLDMVDSEQELGLVDLVRVAGERLADLDCEVVLRAFQPDSVPALYLDSPEAHRERDRAQAQAEADPLWSQILAALGSTEARAKLVLNCLNPVVRHIASLSNMDLLATGVDAIYGQALLMTHRPLRAADAALLNRTFNGLLEWASGFPQRTDD